MYELDISKKVFKNFCQLEFDEHIFILLKNSTLFRLVYIISLFIMGIAHHIFMRRDTN